MSFRISHIHDYTRFIAIDLGTYRVKAAIYALKDGELYIESRASIRQKQKNFDKGSIASMQGVATSINSVIHKVSSKSNEIPEDIILAYSPSICIHDSLSSQYLRDDPMIPLSMDEIDIMLRKVEGSSLLRAKKKAKNEYAVTQDDIRLISSTLTSISIDGISVDSPLGHTGKHIRIQVINIYALASEYNILSSIVASLGKKTISIVPMAIILPKIKEEAGIKNETTLFIDIGYTHITIVLEKNKEISSFDSFHIGVNMLLDMIGEEFPQLNLTERENLLFQDNHSHNIQSIVESVVKNYLSYIIDTLTSLLTKEAKENRFHTMYLSGGIFGSIWIKALFIDIIKDTLGYSPVYKNLPDLFQSGNSSSQYSIVGGLSYLSRDLLYTKKDPIIRILRYTLYHYE